MDIKVYKKETVPQPSGSEDVFIPDIIDIIPEFVEAEDNTIDNNTWTLDSLKKVADVKIINNNLIINSDKVTYRNGNLYVRITIDQLIGCELVEGRDELEQACALATIFQRGLDPLDLNDGIRWSQAILEELSVIQLIQDITEAVGKVTTSVKVVFDTVEDEKGNQYLSYKLLEVA
jgi:hypothetical protein